jgi:uncharacterized protein
VAQGGLQRNRLVAPEPSDPSWDAGQQCAPGRQDHPFINLLEATHLIYRLAPHGYGKEILRARYKIYMADAAISASVLLKGKSMLEDQAALGRAVETAFFKHVFTRYYNVGIGFSYWRGKKDEEVYIVAQVQGWTIPFEVKYRYQNTGLGELKGLSSFCSQNSLSTPYLGQGEQINFQGRSDD